MEAVGEFAPSQAARLGQISDAPMTGTLSGRSLRAVPRAGSFGGRLVSDGGQASGGGRASLVSDGGGSGDLGRSLELLKRAGTTAVADAALLDFGEAADLAAEVEEISRTVEYLQIVAAGAVDRTRRQAATAARSAAVGPGSASSGAGWVTGWGNETEPVKLFV